MNIINIFGILLDLALLFTLVLAVKRRARPLSKIFLSFFGLSALYYLTLMVGGERVKEAFQRFQNGTVNVLGLFCVLITMLLALAMDFQWMVDWFAGLRGWSESRKKEIVPLIWLIALCVFCVSGYFYFQQIQNEVGHMGNSMNGMNSQYSK